MRRPRGHAPPAPCEDGLVALVALAATGRHGRYFASASPWPWRSWKQGEGGAAPEVAPPLADPSPLPSPSVEAPSPPSSSSPTSATSATTGWRLPSSVRSRWPSILIPLPSLGGGDGTPASSTARRATLVTVADFFEGARATARAVFDELDADGDGLATEADVRRALKSRGLPPSYAARLVRDARGPGRWWSSAMTRAEFCSLMQAREPSALRAYTALGVNSAGRLDTPSIRAALARSGVAPALSDEAARSMLRVLGAGAEGDGAASYRHWRAFVSLLPPPDEEEDGGGSGGGLGGDSAAAARASARSARATQAARLWYEAAGLLPVGPPAAVLEAEEAAAAAVAVAGAASTASPTRPRALARRSLLRAAAAGGLSSAITTSALFPLDSLKTRLQVAHRAAGGLAPILAAARAAPLAELYRGVIPATAGSFLSHGIRASAYEAALAGLAALAVAAGTDPAAGLGELRRQALASGGASFVGVMARLPTEVLKQRLQCGAYPDWRTALSATVRDGGPRALFRGGAATLAREVPFYSAGFALFTALKSFADGSAAAADHAPARDLAAWEMIALGAAAGALASFASTPFDVVKSLVMTAPPGAPVSASAAVASILAADGVRGLWRGALPRAVWVAPQGAMHFAFYELVRGPRGGGGGTRRKAAAEAAAEGVKEEGGGSGGAILG